MISIPSYLKEDYDDYIDEARNAAETALALDPTQLNARLTLAQMANIRGESGPALDQFRTIIDQSPNDSLPRLWYAISLFTVGYVQEAYDQISVAVELDPVHATVLDWYARIALALGHHDVVHDAANRTVQLGRPQGLVALINYSLIFGALDDVDAMLGPEDSPWAGFRQVFMVRDNPEALPEAVEWLEQHQKGPAAPYMIMQAYLVSGSVDEFYEILDKIVVFDETIDFMLWLPSGEPLRQDSRFNAWAQKRGYDGLWRARGAPDFCQPAGEGWDCQ